MDCIESIKKLGLSKIEEAKCLLRNGFVDGAYYIGGYSIELLLKARGCKTLGIENFFDDSGGKMKVKNPDTFRVHNLEQLLLLSGIYTELNTQMANDNELRKNWFKLIVWNEKSRYLTGKTSLEVDDFVISIDYISKWILNYL